MGWGWGPVEGSVGGGGRRGFGRGPTAGRRRRRRGRGWRAPSTGKAAARRPGGARGRGRKRRTTPASPAPVKPDWNQNNLFCGNEFVSDKSNAAVKTHSSP